MNEKELIGATMVRWVMLRAEFGATGLWNMAGDVVCPEDLSIDAALQARIAAWVADYEDAESAHPGAPPWEAHGYHATAARLNREGREIGYALKAALPSDWTVVVEDLDGWLRSREGESSEHWLLTWAGTEPGQGREPLGTEG